MSGRASSPPGPEPPTTVPGRIVTAARCLAPAGNEHVLEIGCGTGAAVEHLLGTYPGLAYTAVDRSAHAVRQTQRRTGRLMDIARLTVVRAELSDLTVELGTGTRFDLAFAINVNVFWTTHATAEAAVLAAHLKPGARLCLVYTLPDGRRRDDIGERVLRSLNIPELHTTLSSHEGHLVVSSRRTT